MSFLYDFHLPPDIEFLHTEEAVEKGCTIIRHLWATQYKSQWNKDCCKNLKERLDLDHNVHALAYRCFKDPAAAKPKLGEEVWFDYYKTPIHGTVQGFSIAKDAYLVKNSVGEHWVDYNHCFYNEVDALVDMLRAYASKLVSIYPRDPIRVDPFTDSEIAEKIIGREPVRRAISFVLNQLEPLFEEKEEEV